MAFSTRRGRPCKDPLLQNTDYGTPELRQKRQLSITTEAIDLLLQKDIITPEQHWCGLHFRWLYTLRYGSPTPQSLDPSRVKGLMHPKIYIEWQEERETEWKEAIQQLNQHRCLHAVNACVIYNDYQPVMLSSLLTGLSALTEQWCH